VRVRDEESFEAERWDEFIAEFGVVEYVRVRYLEAVRGR